MENVTPKIDDMREMELKLLIIEYNKGSQLDRSFGRTLLPEVKLQFRQRLIDICLKLMNLVDSDLFTNEILRERISELKNIHQEISYGQAQKVINVVMKQYCFLLGKTDLYKELDCPLDSITMRGKYSMKNLTKEQYLKFQKSFEEKHGLRILADLEYDTQRVANFLNI